MADFTTCDISHLPLEKLIPALLTKTENGEWAIRTMTVDACAENAIDCNLSALPLDVAIKKCIGIDPICGKPALRLASAYAVGTYANDAAAAAATPAVPVGGIYYKTGVGLVARVA